MNYEVINIRTEKGAKDRKERVYEYSCSNKDNCELYKKGKCFKIGAFRNCIYGSLYIAEGYTTKAKRYGDLITKAQLSDKYNLLEKTENNVIAKVGEYTLIDIDYLNHVFELKDLVVEKRFIKGDLTIEIARLILDGKAIAYNGSVIKDFEDEKKHFLRQLKNYNREMYDELIKDYNEYAVDKKYILNTYFPLDSIKEGNVKISSITYYWNGKDELRCKTKDALRLQWDMLDHDMIIKIEDATKQKALVTSIEQFKNL